MNINELREEIDAVDQTILQAFLRQMELAEGAAAYKHENGLPLADKARERALLHHAQTEAGELAPYAFELFHTLINLSKARQYQRFPQGAAIRAQVEAALAAGEEVFPRGGTVACQGIEGANSQAACDKLFPQGNIVYVKTFDAVFDAVESGLCQFGVLPIENSSSGSVRAVYDLLQQRQFSIVRATNLHIRHALLARPGAKLANLREIYSHEQAFLQCGKVLATLPNGVKLIPCENTATAAQMVADSGRDDCAAIAAQDCAALYGLNALNEQIADSENNHTRFICISKEPKIFAGANKISLILSCRNESGSLYSNLSKLAARGINMSKLESYPVTGRSFEFSFFIDVDASVREDGVLAMLEELEYTAESCAFLGNYAVV